MNVSQIQVGDLITHINGISMDGYDERIIEVGVLSNGVAKARTPNAFRSDVERWLYDDQHEVSVEQELPDSAFVVISDSLLLMQKTLNEMGVPSPNVDATLKALHRFSTPSVNTQVVIRPKTS